MMLKQIKNRVAKFQRDERGASAIEYAVMAAILIVVIAAAVRALDLDDIFSTMGDKITAEHATGAGA